MSKPLLPMQVVRSTGERSRGSATAHKERRAFKNRSFVSRPSRWALTSLPRAPGRAAPTGRCQGYRAPPSRAATGPRSEPLVPDGSTAPQRM
ncbi:hypothetical protein G6F60_015442 [Rhizopus arrhizus]|nr:hypothetical protein G6F60_015442 [Rhizopus arrhizus]